ncbi:hypothetical protein D3C84_1176800 [compost metagenome]
MITCRIDRIASVGKLRPEGVREEFVLGHRWPVVVALVVMLVGAVYLLQKHHVGGDTAHRLAQFRQDESPV